MIRAAALLIAAAWPLCSASAKEPLPPYAESIRCAGLAEAAARREKDGLGFGRTAFDAAFFWGMAASEAARKDGISGERFTRDQAEAAAAASAELASADGTAARELERCISRVPPVPAKGERG